MAAPKTPRSIRNNNPLNIRIGNTWLGETPFATDSEFETFVHIRYGLRAAFCILRRYIRKYRRNTVEKIVRAWPTGSTLKVEDYISIVCQRSGLEPATELYYDDEEAMESLVGAMAFVESGQVVPWSEIIEAYDIA